MSPTLKKIYFNSGSHLTFYFCTLTYNLLFMITTRSPRGILWPDFSTETP